jgi:peroxiredoxin
MRLGILALALALGTATAAIAAPPAAAPDFSLRDLAEKTHTLAQYKGKVVLLNFWATWCGPCQVEMPHLQKLHTDFSAKGLVILGISADEARDKSKVKPLITGKGITYPVLLDPTRVVVGQYNPTSILPYNVIVDRTGAIAKQHSGYNPGDELTLRAEIEALLAQP